MDIAKLISEALEQQVNNRGKASLVVCSGNSVLKIFNNLSKKKISWNAITVTLVDNRDVYSNHKHNNERLIRKKLLINNAKNAQFVSLHQKNLKELIRLLPFSVTLLSMALDGHYASIFSKENQQKSLMNPNSSPEIVKIEPIGNPKLPRLTMNLSFILESQLIVLLIHGNQKVEIFKKLKNVKGSPIKLLLDNLRNEIILDKGNEEPFAKI